jgi:O-antigen/teichoic acid export membrane protein
MTEAARGTVRKGAAYAAVSQVVAVAGFALTNVVVARSLGPAGTGQFSVLVTVVSFAIVFAPLGLEYGITYFVGAGRWAPGAAFRDAQLVVATTTPLAVVILWLVPPALVDDIYGNVGSGTVLAALASIPFAVSWTLTAAVALAVADYRTYALAPVVQAAGMCVLTATGAIAFGIAGAAVGLAAAHATAAAVTWWSLRATGSARPEEQDDSRRNVRRAATYGFPISIANGLSLVNRRADLLIVSAILGAAQAGPYAIALAISSLQVMLPRALAAVILPRVARDANAAPGSGDVLDRSSRHAVILSCGAGLAVVAVTPLIPLVYGPDFRPAMELTLILVPGSVAYGIASVLTAGIIGQGKSSFPLVAALVTAPPTVVAYLVATHAFGTTGAAVASSVSYAVVGLLAAGYSMRIRAVPARKLFVPRREDWAAYRQLLGAASRLLLRRA